MTNTKIKYIALGNDNLPLLNGIKKTVKSWKFYGNRNRDALNKKLNFECIVAIILPEISGRSFIYTRLGYGKK